MASKLYRVKLPNGNYVASHVRNTAGKLRLHKVLSYTSDPLLAQTFTHNMASTVARANGAIVVA